MKRENINGEIFHHEFEGNELRIYFRRRENSNNHYVLKIKKIDDLWIESLAKNCKKELINRKNKLTQRIDNIDSIK